ncbi:hypothetical protein [Roseococcus pinisoli]|uniref:Transposase n=1 Tax=Roseococcus pinisoli TaxID=2835040 RepID=A0ABS5QFK9_9PROT|nr:hypothetical protein [Roseococcus pinisoli]MBS7812278.1 hypothetical protein [Roseococcus pinisoli]
MDDERLEYLIGYLRDHHAGGFVNWVVHRDELLNALVDLQKLRERPLHCPSCNGDHP